ncbi:MAG: restriction endonuclease [Anaerolineales bacterium]|nr:restriction endonuclease [Anaerolineales bacterium]
MASFYPQYLRQRFTNRVRELNFLQGVANDVIAGHPRRVALWGLRRVGKTLLIYEQIARLLEDEQVLPVYMDFEDICTSPEMFAQRYIGLIAFWALTAGQGEVDAYLTVERLLETAASDSTTIARTATSLLRELSLTKPDQALLLKLAFDFPEKLAQERGRNIILFLDEFTEIATLSHYPQIREPLKHLRSSLAGQEHVAYVVAGSAMTAMMDLFQTPEAPLFLQFETIELGPFDRQDSRTLVARLGGDFSPEVEAELYQYTQGYPFYVTSLARRIHRLAIDGEVVDVDLVRYAFLLETLWRGGQIYNYCRYVYDLSLQRARGYGMLKAILQELAEEDDLTLSQIARPLRKSPSAVRDYLRWLMEVDLIVEQDKHYRYRDAVLRFWVAYTSKGLEMDAFPRREDLAGLVRDLEERFQRTATDLGRAKEAQVRELLRMFSGQLIPGDLLGWADEITLPSFSQVGTYRSPDGQVELDALAETDTGLRWVVEVKWRSRRAGVKEIKKLADNARELGAEAWLISREGFTPRALEQAQNNGVMTSTGDELMQLTKLLEYEK